MNEQIRMNDNNIPDRSIRKRIRLGISKLFQIPYQQVPRVLYHGVLLSTIIAGFWLLDSLKDPVLSNTVGIEYQPLAKLLSVVTTLFVVCIYDFLTSLVSKPMLFHIISWIYFILMMSLSVALSDPTIGLPNLSLGPHRYLGWITYCTVESYGSLTVAVFWSFTNSLMNLEEAKGAYGLIIAIAQVGAILGSTLASYAAVLTIPGLFILGSVFILSVSLFIKLYHIIFHDYNTELMKTKVRSISEASVEPLLPPVETAANRKPPPPPAQPESLPSQALSLLKTVSMSVLTVFSGFYEGVYLIFQYPYVLKLLAVSCIYDIVVTILDYEFKIMGAKHTIHPELITEELLNSGHITDEYANLLGHFGQLTNFTSFFLSLFGFSYLVHSIGVQKSLLIFPVTLGIAVIVISLVPKIWVLFVFVSTLKAMVFSLHDPTKELLYIPTSEAIKYKAKAWIDVFGSRLAKAVASMITFLSFGRIDLLRKYSDIPLLLLTGLVIYLTWSIGNDFHELIDSKKIVGEEDLDINHGDGMDGPMINGLKPGDVGYSGYDPKLFEGVFDDEEFNYNIEMIQGSGGRSSGPLPFEHYHKRGIDRNSTASPKVDHATNTMDFFGKTPEELFEYFDNPMNNSTNSSNNKNKRSGSKKEDSQNRSRTKSSNF
jgi:AAA family ATP:ADP antiporter